MTELKTAAIVLLFISVAKLQFVQYLNRGIGLTSIPGDILPSTTTLFLDYNNFKELNDSQFTHLPLLTLASLTHNLIATIDAETFQGTVVSFLDLQHNSLSSVPDLRAINQTLHRLFISKNLITSIPRDYLLTLRNLVELRVARNRLTEMPLLVPGIALVTLTLEGNWVYNITDEEVAGIGSSSLTRLGISETGNTLQRLYPVIWDKLVWLDIAYSPADFTNVSIPYFSRLRNLEIQLNPGLTEFPDVSLNNQTLQLLNLKSNILRDPPQTWLRESIASLGLLNYLDVSLNQLTTFPDVTCTNAARLDDFKFAYNPASCDCRVAWMKNDTLLAASDVTVTTTGVICSGPPLYADTYWANADFEEYCSWVECGASSLSTLGVVDSSTPPTTASGLCGEGHSRVQMIHEHPSPHNVSDVIGDVIADTVIECGRDCRKRGCCSLFYFAHNKTCIMFSNQGPPWEEEPHGLFYNRYD